MSLLSTLPEVKKYETHLLHQLMRC